MERCWVVHPPEPKASTRSLTVAVGHESTEHANSENADCIELGVRARGCDQRKQQPKPGAVARGRMPRTRSAAASLAGRSEATTASSHSR